MSAEELRAVIRGNTVYCPYCGDTKIANIQRIAGPGEIELAERGEGVRMLLEVKAGDRVIRLIRGYDWKEDLQLWELTARAHRSLERFGIPAYRRRGQRRGIYAYPARVRCYGHRCGKICMLDSPSNA